MKTNKNFKTLLQNSLLCIVSSCMIVYSSASLSEPNWIEEYNEDGLIVLTAETPNSEYKMFRGTVNIDASVNQIIDVIQDIDDLPSWYHNNKSARVLKNISDNQSLRYTVTSLPWPVSNRDTVLLSTTTVNDNHTYISLEGKPRSFPKKEGLVRVTYLKGHWKVTKISLSESQVEFQLSVIPGGSIPSWLANSLVVDLPLHSLTNLKDKF